MLLKLYQKERRINDLWAIALFIISVSTAITLSYLNQDKESLPDLYNTLANFNYWEIFTTFSLFLCIYSCAIGLLYFYTVPVMHAIPKLYFLLPFMILFFTRDGSSEFFQGIFFAVFTQIIYKYIGSDTIKYAGHVAKLSIRIILKHFPVILLAIFSASSLIILLVIQTYLSLCTLPSRIRIFIIFNLIWSINLIYYFTYVFISSLVCFNVKCRKGYYFHAFVNTFYSAGSLVFAGLILIIVQSVRIVIMSFLFENDSLSNFYCILYLIADIHSSFINQFYEWAFVYIALLGNSYISACKKALDDLCDNPIIKIINNKCLSYVLFFINFSVFLICHCMFEKVQSHLIGAVSGLLFTIYISLAFDSANKTLLILYTEDKDALNAVYGNIVEVLDMQVADNIR